MSKDDFDASEFAARHVRIRAAMDETGIDLPLVFHPVNIQYLIGRTPKVLVEPGDFLALIAVDG